MNRFQSTLTVLAMLLVADVVCMWQTIDSRDLFTNDAMTALIAVESAVGLAILAIASTLLERRFRILSRATPFEPARPLRRLLSAVWS